MLRYRIILFSLFAFCIKGISQNDIQPKVDELVAKKAEYHKLSNGTMDGYRIKIHFGVDRDEARSVKTKFLTKFPDLATYEEYQQPNFVILVGDYKTKLEAFESLKKVQTEFTNAFIVKGKINP